MLACLASRTAANRPRTGNSLVTFFAVGLWWAPRAAAQSAENSSFRVGGLVIGDADQVLSYHTDDGAGAAGLVARLPDLRRRRSGPVSLFDRCSPGHDDRGCGRRIQVWDCENPHPKGPASTTEKLPDHYGATAEICADGSRTWQ